MYVSLSSFDDDKAKRLRSGNVDSESQCFEYKWQHSQSQTKRGTYTSTWMLHIGKVSNK